MDGSLNKEGKREAEANKKATEDNLKNEKIRDSENVFVMAGNKKEAAVISSSNDEEASLLNDKDQNNLIQQIN